MKEIKKSQPTLVVRCTVAFTFLCTLSMHNLSHAQSCPQSNPYLASAWDFAVLGSSTVTNTGPTTITGDIGVSPGSSFTGGGTITHTGDVHVANTVAGQAQSDALTGYNILAGFPINADMTGQDLGGKVLQPGIYRFSTSAQLTGTLTLDTLGDPNALFIFQIGSTLTTASNSVVNVIGGDYQGIYWQVGSSATIGLGTAFTGNIIANSSITLDTGANLECGRALALNGAVTLDSNLVQGCGAGVCQTQDPDKLQSPAFSKFNTYLGQWNFAELVNQGPAEFPVQITVLNLLGEEMISHQVIIPANNQVDVDINALVKFACDVLEQGCEQFEDLSETRKAENGLGFPDGIVDTYGLVRFEFDDTISTQRLLGRMSYYRPNKNGTFSYGFSREFSNPVRGLSSFATSNTYDPQGRGNLVPNWAEIINLDSAPQNFTLNIYDQEGVLKDSRQTTVSPMGEFDLQAGHEFVGSTGNLEQGVFLVEVIPANLDFNYFFSVSRYSSNSPSGVDPESYSYAFTIEGTPGSIQGLFAPTGNRLNAVQGLTSSPLVTNWVEIANVESSVAAAVVTFRNSAGEVVNSQSLILAAKSQIHLNAGAVLPPGEFGTVEVQSTRGLLAESMSYVHGTQNDLQAGFRSPGRKKGPATTTGSINTFLGMQDVLRVVSTSMQDATVNFFITSFSGGTFSGSFPLEARGVSSLLTGNNPAFNVPADTYGAFLLDTTQTNTSLSEVHRIRVANGIVDFVMPTLVQ